jgi:hypothetical protein
VEVATWWSGEEAAPESIGGARVLALAAEAPFAVEGEAAGTAPAEGLDPWIDAVRAELSGRGPKGQPGLVYAIGLPAGAIVAGQRIAAEFGAKLVADLGDPWPEGERREEERRQALGATNALVTTTETLAERLRGDLPEGAEVLVAPNGGELRRRPQPPAEAPPLVVHLGAINAGRVDPRPAFEALVQLEREGRIRFRSHTTGFHPEIDELPDRRLPMLSHEEALGLTASATAALVLGNDDPSQLPSKAFEIACTETWALCVGGDDDPARTLLTSTGHAVPVAANTQADVRAAVGEILVRDARGERPEPAEGMTWEARVGQVAALLAGLA